MKKKDINFALGYVHAGGCGGQNKCRKKLYLPLAIKSLLIPIFAGLSNESLLENCLHIYTQNYNDTINSVIWKNFPKDVFVSKKVLEIVVTSAAIEFNNGSNGLKPAFNDLGIKICLLY